MEQLQWMAKGHAGGLMAASGQRWPLSRSQHTLKPEQERRCGAHGGCAAFAFGGCSRQHTRSV